MPTIKYYQFENEEHLKRAKELIDPLLQYFPTWVLEIDIYAQPLEHTDHLNVNLAPRYRRLYFNFGPIFWTSDHGDQKADVVHEFFHAILGELVDWVRRSLIDPIKEKDEALFNMLEREYTDRSERVTQELACLLGRLIPPV